MELMSVTLDVSKLSGWLNAVLCRATTGLKEGNAQGERREGMGAVAVHAARTEDPAEQW
tara:strand:- start:258 stop:434 length:177 start_codon:yes stop_codon:yes gene_type:complete